MKSGRIIRSIGGSQYDRVTGDAPSLGRVARMPGAGLPKERLHKRRSNSQSRRGRARRDRQRVVRIRTTLLSVLAISCLAMTIWLGMSFNMANSAKSSGKQSAKVEIKERVISKFPSPTEADTLAMVKMGVSIRDPEQISKYFRLRTSSPQEVVDFLEGMKTRDGVVKGYRWLSSVDANGLSIDGVLINFTGEGKTRKRLALLTPDASGKWKIDFDAFARKVTPSWEEFFEKGAATAQVRTYIATDSYYNGPFKDDTWTCYGIATPDREEVLLGYCKIGSPQAAALQEILAKGGKTFRVFLEIRRVDGAESRQVEISRVLAEGWVMSETPFDERVK